MSVINQNLLLTPEGYQISRSVRLRSSASAYFSRTPASAGNRTTWTWSGWLKLGQLSTGANQAFFAAGNTSAGDYIQLAFDGTTQALYVTALNSSSIVMQKIATSVYRDPSAWYHVVFAYDSTQATSTNRMKMYVNGVQITSFSTNTDPSLNTQTLLNSTNQHTLSSLNYTSRINYFDGYMTEVNFVDGQQLTPSSFGETDSITGVWKAKKYAGTYGTNGFYLNFSDNSSNTAATIGKDSSGNGNNWTPNNISVTAGVTYDSMIDVPTLWADGGNGRGNYAVLNPLKKPSTATITNGNLDVTWTVTGGEQPASFAQSSGKWYWELTQNAGVSAPGILLESAIPSNNSITQGYHYYGGNGQFYTAVSGVAYGATFSTGDIIGVALDLDNNQITFYKNNTSQGTKTIVAGLYNPDFASAGTVTINANFGQRPFAYTPPTGFKALNTQNLPDSTIPKGNQYFDATAYTGTGASNAVVNSGGFQPDLVWLKARSIISSNLLYDAQRGALNYLSSNQTAAEASLAGSLTAFNSNGFSLGTNLNSNSSGVTFVGWQWKAAGSTVSNTSGSITSTVSANTSAGFSVVSFVNASSTNQETVGHGLGVAPKLIISKNRDTSANNWAVFHASVCDTTSKFLKLNATDAVATYSTVWGAALPTSSVFGVTGGGIAAASVNVIAYCFAEVAGYSKFGSYTGNGSADGPFVYTNMRPRFILIKRTDTAGFDWILQDTSRSTYNSADSVLNPNSSASEQNGGGYNIDVLSNGFKLRNSGGQTNASGGTYIFAAFCESPFKTSLAR